tara:strand:+ start:1019 stop:1174 length:156 start_codon:yes stop_codon:yes gene_type:complete
LKIIKSLGYEIKEGKNKSKTESVNLTADREKRSGKSKKKQDSGRRYVKSLL